MNYSSVKNAGAFLPKSLLKTIEVNNKFISFKLQLKN